MSLARASLRGRKYARELASLIVLVRGRPLLLPVIFVVIFVVLLLSLLFAVIYFINMSDRLDKRSLRRTSATIIIIILLLLLYSQLIIIIIIIILTLNHYHVENDYYYYHYYYYHFSTESGRERGRRAQLPREARPQHPRGMRGAGGGLRGFLERI